MLKKPIDCFLEANNKNNEEKSFLDISALHDSYITSSVMFDCSMNLFLLRNQKMMKSLRTPIQLPVMIPHLKKKKF